MNLQSIEIFDEIRQINISIDKVIEEFKEIMPEKSQQPT